MMLESASATAGALFFVRARLEPQRQAG